MTAITLVQSNSAVGSASPVTVTLSPTTAHNCLVVCVAEGNSTTNPTVSGITLGGAADNFAIVPGASVANSADANVEIWTDQNCAGGQTSVAVSFNSGTGAGNGYNVFVYEFSGVATTSAVDTKNAAGAASGAWSSGSTGTLTQANEVAVGIGAGVGSIGAPSITGPTSPWNNLTSTSAARTAGISGYQIVSATSALTYSGTVSTGRVGAAIITLSASNAVSVTTPNALPVTPYPLYVISPAGSYIPQNPANKPNVYVQGTTAAEIAAASIGAPTVSKTGLVSGESVRASTGQFYIQVPYNIPAPFPGTSPYPFNIIPRPFIIQPQNVAGTATPPTVVNGLIAQDTVVAPAGDIQIILQGIYSWSFPFGNNLPNPLRVTYRNLKPSIQGQPQVFIAKPGVPNVSAIAPVGTVKISPSVSANENVVARFGTIYIVSITSQPLPFTNYPSRYKLRNMRPDYSSGKQWLPTNIHGPTANETVTAYFGSPAIGRAVEGFVSNVFAATVPGTTVNKEIEPTADVGVVARLGVIKNTAFGVTAHETTSANAGTIAVKIPGPVSRSNVNPEFGRVSAGSSFAGNVSAVTATANIGHPTVSLSKVAGVTVVSVQGHPSVNFTKNNTNVTTSARLGTITISQANTARVAVASVVSKKVSVSGITAKVTSGSISKTKISVSPQPASVAVASLPETRTSIGETSSTSVIASIGTVKIIIPAHVSGVTAKANNQGKVVAGLTATSHSIAIMGSISTSVITNGKITVAAHLGTGGQARANIFLIPHQGPSARLIGSKF